MMIILHSEFAKASREFVEQYGEGNTVLTYPECIEAYPATPAFPAVVVTMPEKTIQAYTVPEHTDPETGEDIPMTTVREEVIASYEYIYPEPDSPAEIDAFVAEYLADDPGTDYR